MSDKYPVKFRRSAMKRVPMRKDATRLRLHWSWQKWIETESVVRRGVVLQVGDGYVS